MPEFKRFLLVKHSEGWNVDRCCLWMERTGQSYDWCYPASGQSFPDPENYSGVVVFGGAPSANDCGESPWIKNELKFIERCLELDKSFLGICLGAQMLARVMGAKVEKHPQELKEVGFTTVHPTNEAGGFLNQPLNVMQWHSEGFGLPSGATRLAYNERFPNQAFRVGEHIVGVQFHPEVNLDVLRLWHERNKTRPTGVLDDATREAQVADAILFEPSITTWFNGFLNGWVGKAVKAA